MHTADNAHNEAALLCAVHEGHQDLATFLYVADSLYLLHVAKGSTGLRNAGDVGGNGGRLLWKAGGRQPAKGSVSTVDGGCFSLQGSVHAHWARAQLESDGGRIETWLIHWSWAPY